MVRIATWNTEWATPGTSRGDTVAAVLASLGADVIVLTEGRADLLPTGGYVIEAGSDWGYRVEDPLRRKVLMWSRWPWIEIDMLGSEELPSGRFVAGTVQSSLGEVRIVGLCVPWSGAHVTHGRRDRRRWEDHERFLRALGPALARRDRPTVLAGDLNQRIPPTTQPARVAQLLAEVLGGFEVPTAGVTAPQLIDHIAHSPDLTSTGPPVLIPDALDGQRLSDHTGVIVELMPASPR
ncbi:MAG: endonuclease/exonuclease/phosphatase family protein [Acidobacteria bacterium]|nr:endonuclease/exonuclease/phosphatase family protein [Acidobacteriota bacterium]